MTPIRVLIVDDSITMRALFTTVLEEAPGITVVDCAANAAEARTLIDRLKPDVVTLDVEMPGTSGLELLREIMTRAPLPVIMLSTLTQKGAAATLEALELGAYDCFAKPKAATMEEFRRVGPKLAKIVKAAANGKVAQTKAGGGEPFVTCCDNADQRVIALIGNTGAVEMIGSLISRFPIDCPPTIVHLGDAQNVAEALVDKLDKSARPTVRLASDGQRLEPGNVYLVADATRHAVVDRWPAASIRMVPGDPIAGHRPSANLLLQSLAKTAAGAVSAGLLSGLGDDGVAALGTLRGIGAHTLAVQPELAKARELPELAIAMAGATPVDLDTLGRMLLAPVATQMLAA
ncbi:chemotaxis protein CheB [Sphingomonas sp. 1P06PA]|uniref:chemotaxis protein CheB n=1 Tax=Sphingomonas sp. 1P06PA TaxID=554121 RepID=UPI0039A64B04